jgi:hypothetical protein
MELERLVIGLLKKRSLSIMIVHPILEPLWLHKPSYKIYKGLGRTDWHIIIEPRNYEKGLEFSQKLLVKQASCLIIHPERITQWPTPLRAPEIHPIEPGWVEITFFGEQESGGWFRRGGEEGSPLA